MISDRISDNIPPKMEILNWVIPILMHFCSFVSNWSFGSHKATHHPKKCDIIICDSISQDKLSQIFEVIQSDVALQNQVH